MFLMGQKFLINSYIGNSAVGFAKTVRNSSFSGVAEAKFVRRKTNLAFWLAFLNTFLAKKKSIRKENSNYWVQYFCQRTVLLRLKQQISVFYTYKKHRIELSRCLVSHSLILFFHQLLCHQI